MPNWQYHSAADPCGFVAHGTIDEARAYLARINAGRTQSLWTRRLAGGDVPRGLSLAALIATNSAPPVRH